MGAGYGNFFWEQQTFLVICFSYMFLYCWSQSYWIHQLPQWSSGFLICLSTHLCNTSIELKAHIDLCLPVGYKLFLTSVAHDSSMHSSLRKKKVVWFGLAQNKILFVSRFFIVDFRMFLSFRVEGKSKVKLIKLLAL